jgi:hypothetical protein
LTLGGGGIYRVARRLPLSPAANDPWTSFSPEVAFARPSIAARTEVRLGGEAMLMARSGVFARAGGPRGWAGERGALSGLAVLAAALAASGCDAPTTPGAEEQPVAAVLAPDARDVSAWPAAEEQGTHRPATLFFAASDPDRMLQLMADAHVGGTSGFYLRELGGSVHLAENETFVFEPASTIKALVHFHAMRQVQDGALIGGNPATLALQVQNAWATPPNSSCPQPAAPFSASLQTGLTAMMVPSDNPWTQALRDLFGDGPIDATRQTFDMTNTALQHRIGCGADALASPNQLTLVDAGKMYESVATGFLTGATRDEAWAIMLTDAALFNTMIDEEAAGLGLSSGGVSDFKAQRRSALKAGSYTLSSLQYRSVAGWAELGVKDASCALAPRAYVYGAFIHQADELTGLGIRALGVETFREQVRASLESWADCEADLRVFSPQVIGLGAPLNVNEVITFTVRHTVRNDGPAPSIDAVLTTTLTGPADCTIEPALDSRPVDGLGAASVVVDIPVEMTCANPSNHVFQIGAAIEAANAAVNDPDLENNTSSIFVSREFIAYADLAITDWDFAELDGAGLGDFMVGEMFTFETIRTVHNFGDTQLGTYHDAADVLLSRSLTVPDGVRGMVRVGTGEAFAQVVVQRQGQPDQVHDNLAAGSTVSADGEATIIVNYRLNGLSVAETRAVIEEFGVSCLAPGEHELLFASEIAAVDPHLLDPDLDNNVLDATKTIDCALPVQVNIRPGNQHNPITPASHQNVPVALLTTEKGEYGLPLAFDAATADPGSARFGTLAMLGQGAGSTASQHFLRDSFEMDDRTKDGDIDLVLHFGIVGTGADVQTAALCVTGSFLGEGGVWFTFLGCDAMKPTGPATP